MFIQVKSVFLIIFNLIRLIWCQKCDQFIVKNAHISFCDQIDANSYNLTVKCEPGYEIQPNITSYNFITAFDFYDVVQCKASGCSVASIPNKILLDQSNLQISKVYCVRTSLFGYCNAKDSYIDFKCKDGLIDLYDGDLRVRCLGNYSWDLLPFCANINLSRSTEPVYDFLNNMTTTVPIQTSSIPPSIPISTQTEPLIIPSSTSIPIPNQTSEILITSLLSTLVATSIKTSPQTQTFNSRVSTKISLLSPSCSLDYPTPLNIQPKKVSFNLIPHEILKNRYKIGSSVKFQCIPGFYVLNAKFNLTTVCRSNSTWTQVADCEQLPCWDKLPARPLNGERTATLLLNKFNSSTDGTSVGFKCNSYFDLVGVKKIVCINNTWSSSPPTCKLTNSTCFQKPPVLVKTAKLINLEHAVLKVEKSLNGTFNKVNAFISARYTCPGNKFAPNQTVKYNDKNIGHVEVLCIGSEIWQEVKCIA